MAAQLIRQHRVVLAGVAGGVLAALTASAISVRWSAIILGLLYVAASVGVIGRMGLRNSRTDLFAPPVLFLSYLTIGVGIKGLWDLIVGQTRLGRVIDPSAPEFHELMVKVFVYAIIASGSFLAGDWIAGRRRDRPRSPVLPVVSPRVLKVALLGGVGMSVVGVGILFARLGAVVLTNPEYVVTTGGVGMFWVFPLLHGSLYACALVAACNWERRGKAGFLAVAGVVVSAGGAYLVTSSKATLVTAVMILLVLRHYLVAPVRIRTVLIGTLAFMVALPLLYAHRVVGLSGELLRSLNADMLMAGLQVFLNRAYLADSFASVIMFTPTVFPYRFGSLWLELFYFWVPRAIWPSKPLTFSIEFGETYLASERTGGLTFYSPTLMGDAYLNLGPLGVPLVFFLIGLACRLWYRRMVQGERRADLVLLYAASAYWVAIWPEQSIGITTSLAVSYLVPCALVVLATRVLADRIAAGSGAPPM